MNEQIVPSWEDAANRWMNAYLAMKAERDALAAQYAEACDYVNHYTEKATAAEARCTLTDEETEAVRAIPDYLVREYPVIVAVLRRLLGEELHALGEVDDEQDHEDQHEHATTDIHAPTVGES